MTCRAVLVCPGRGTYNKAELGYLARHHADAALLEPWDKMRRSEGQTPLTELDSAAAFDAHTHVTGDNASPLIYACSLLDRQALAEDIDLVAVTGNSLGWYTALAAAGAVSAETGLKIVNTMGRLMHERGTGGQIVYPCTGPDWRPDPARRGQLMQTVRRIDGHEGVLRLSIDLGGMLVLAGDDAGLAAFIEAVPDIDGRFPMRLPHHAAFHTDLMAPIAEAGRAALPASLFAQPSLPMIDGRGAIWWPGACDLAALHAYTLGAQVTETYDFARAIRHAAREFAPDAFVVAGPGTTLGGSVAQSLIACGWKGLSDRAEFDVRQDEAPLLISMGRPDQREIVTG